MDFKTYLNNFFLEYDYSKEDAHVLMDAYVKISKSPSMSNLWNRALELYEKDINCDYEELVRIADEIAETVNLQEYTLEMLVLIGISQKAREICSDYGMDFEMFHNNMLDLKYKLEECKLVKGIVGTFVPKWYKGFFNFTRFTFGRLQFEIVDFGDNYEAKGITLTPDSKVINVHVPRTGTPLDEKSCDESFKMAKEFFARELNNVCVFVCHSWLLYSENKNILSPKSNTYKFMQRFELIDTKIDKEKCNLWRIFDTEEKNVDRLPENTPMQKAYLKHLKSGGKLGYSKGVYVL